MQSDRQARIRERAYQIWVEEGRVHGKHVEHWRRAENELADEERGTARTRTGRTRKKAPVASEAQPAEVSRSRAKAKPAEPAKPAARSAPAAKAEAAKTVSRGRRQSTTRGTAS